MADHIPILRGMASKGEPIWDRPGAWKMALGALEGRRFEVTIRRERKKRSLNQNSYYWGIVVAMIAEAAGYEPEEAHEALKWELLRVHDDTRLPTVRSTADLTTVEFEDYMARCRRLGAEVYGIYIPDPNECEVK